MLTSGLTNTPLTKLLLIYTIASSVALSILDSKHLVSIHVAPHLWQYGQFWRCLVWQAAGFANSTEALFAAMLVYHSRVVERAWGTRKMATFLVTTLPYTTLLPPLLLVLLLRPLSFHYLNYLPSGTTATIFALLAQYHASIPSTFRYRISSSTSTTSDADANANANADNSQNTNTTTDASAPSTSTPTSSTSKNTPTPTLTVLLSDKSTTYLIAAQLALSQFPNMLLPAITGWAVGVAWRNEILPVVPGTSWRVPAWVVGEKEREGGRGRGRGAGSGRGRRGVGGAEADAEAERFEGLRRRLLSEREAVVAASASASARGSEGSGSGSGRQRVGGRSSGGSQ